MKKITLSYNDADYNTGVAEFMGDQYSVATFGDKDLMFAVLETVGEDERPVLMVQCRDINSVKFSYED